MTLFVYNFVDPDLTIEIFFVKVGAADKCVLIFKEGIERPLHTCTSGVRNFHVERVCLLNIYLFIATKTE